MAPPTLIFGTGNFGQTWTDPTEIEALAEALTGAGITHIDTAARYPAGSPGRSEKLLGDVGFPDRGFTIDTKIFIPDAGSNGSMTGPAIEQSIKQSLGSLRMEKCNVLHSHAPDPATPIVEQAVAVDACYRTGAFCKFGVSNWSLGMLEAYITAATESDLVKPSVYQNQYNVLCRHAEEKIFPALRQHGMRFTAYSPLAGGFLTGKLTFSADGEALTGTRFEEGSYAGQVYRGWYDQGGMHAAVRRLDELCKEYAVEMQDAAMRWLAYHSALKEGDGIIIGASRIEQVQHTAKAVAAGSLPAGLVTGMDALWELCKADADSISTY